MLAPLFSALLAAAPVQHFDPQTGQLRIQQGVLSAPLSGELSSAARSWALARRGDLGLPPGSTLRNAESFGTRFGASFHLQQQLGGVDVYGAKVVVTLDAQARVTLVSSSLTSYRAARTTWVLDAGAALRRAVREVPLPSLWPDGTPYGGGKAVYFATADEVHAGWLVHVPTVDLTHNWYVAIDATDGEVLWRRDYVAHAALDADAYDPSPGGADAGVGKTPTVHVQLLHPDGGPLVVPTDGGFLTGDQLDAYNCCLNQNCQVDAGVNRAQGMTMLPFNGNSVNVKYDVVVCARQQRATNDPTVHSNGSYVYPPVDPPLPGVPIQNDPAASDEFSEVHAFWQVNRVYDRVRALSSAAVPIFPGNQPAITPFQMRDERRVPPRKIAAWTNLVFPSFQSILANPACVLTGTPCQVDTFTRVDNAVFVTVEDGMQIPLPEYRSDVDTLMIFQGDKADFAYDATVLWHEFGHGVVYSTANLNYADLTVSQRAANTEGGALHEGFADFNAASFGNDPKMGPYIGPRMSGGANMTGLSNETFLRTLDNTLACPDVLWGEPHQDSQHVSGALWQARRDHFQGSDQGHTFDAAWYAMLVSLAPQSGFADVALAMDTHVAEAFPQLPDAGGVMEDIFTARGVSHCSDVLDVTDAGAPRPYFGIGNRTQTTLAAGSLIPGPYQLYVRTPQGATAIGITATLQQDLLATGGPPTLQLLARVGSPITFTKLGTSLKSDATASADVANVNGKLSATATVDAPCDGGTGVYLAIANTGDSSAVLTDLAVLFNTKPECAAAPDAGPMMDAGTLPVVGDGGVIMGPTPKGCGCGAAPLGLPLLALAALLARRRRAS
jgi:hypothetical protein